LVTQVRLVTPNPDKERNFATHVEADESAYDHPGPASRAGASNYIIYSERPGHDDE
jgi:hypothetical protein